MKTVDAIQINVSRNDASANKSTLTIGGYDKSLGGSDNSAIFGRILGENQEQDNGDEDESAQAISALHGAETNESVVLISSETAATTLEEQQRTDDTKSDVVISEVFNDDALVVHQTDGESGLVNQDSEDHPSTANNTVQQLSVAIDREEANATNVQSRSINLGESGQELNVAVGSAKTTLSSGGVSTFSQAVLIDGNSEVRLAMPSSEHSVLNLDVANVKPPEKINSDTLIKVTTAEEAQSAKKNIVSGDQQLADSALKNIVEPHLTLRKQNGQGTLEKTGMASTVQNSASVDTTTVTNSSTGDTNVTSRAISIGESTAQKSVVPNNAPQSLNNTVRMMLGREVSSATVNLTPPDLGSMRINIEVKADQLQVQIVATQAVTRDTLESALPRLREQLETDGYGEVSINLSGGELSDSGSEPYRSENVQSDYTNEFEEITPINTIAHSSAYSTASRNLVDLFA